MRPSPGVTVLQYFLISSSQALSSFVILAVNFSRIVFPRFVCAEADPIDKVTSNSNSPRLTSKRMEIFIERPLMTATNHGFLEVAAGPRWRLRVAFRSHHHCAKA